MQSNLGGLDNQTSFFVPIYISVCKIKYLHCIQIYHSYKKTTHTEVIFQELSLKNVLPQINKVKGDQK